MKLETARGIAARIWCEPEYSRVEMDVHFAEAIAILLWRYANEPAPDPQPMGPRAATNRERQCSRVCETCESCEGNHYCLLHTIQLRDAELWTCDDWSRKPDPLPDGPKEFERAERAKHFPPVDSKPAAPDVPDTAPGRPVSRAEALHIADNALERAETERIVEAEQDEPKLALSNTTPEANWLRAELAGATATIDRVRDTARELPLNDGGTEWRTGYREAMDNIRAELDGGPR